MNKKGMKLDDLYSTEYQISLEKFYTRASNFICDGKTTMLVPVWLNIADKQQFYSKTDKKMLFLGPTWTMYLVSEVKDDQGRLMVYAPYLFNQGQVFLVPANLVVKIGYN